MAGHSCARKPVFESLETRTLLDGNLIVSVIGGALIVTGDDKDNIVKITQLAPSNAAGSPVQAASFLVETDANTTINGAPGGPVKFSGVTAGGTSIPGACSTSATTPIRAGTCAASSAT